MRHGLTCAFLSVLLSFPAHGQSLPPQVQAQVDEVSTGCRGFGGNPVPAEGFVTNADLNGDGQPDYIVDLAALNCEGAWSAFCGSAGCPVTVWLSGPAGYFSGGGGYVQEWRVEGRSIRAFIHGQMCDPPRVGAEGCEEVSDFDGVIRPR